MRRATCLFSTAEALCRVFIAPAQGHQFQPLKQVTAHKIFDSRQRHLPRKLLPIIQQRCYANHPTPSERRHPRDNEIKAWAVTVVGEDGKLSEPRNTDDILSSIDRRTQSLIVVKPGDPGNPPICKIVDRKALREAEQARAKTKRSPAATVKTIELNWAVDPNDLGYRLKKMRDFLEKGFKVEVILAPKRRGRKATTEEASALVDKLVDAVNEVNGAKEMKPKEGKLLGEMKIFAEGTVPVKEK